MRPVIASSSASVAEPIDPTSFIGMRQPGIKAPGTVLHSPLGAPVADAGCAAAHTSLGLAQPVCCSPLALLRLQAVAGWDVAALRAGLRAVTALDEGFAARWRASDTT